MAYVFGMLDVKMFQNLSRWLKYLLQTIETGNPPSSILSALKEWASNSRSLASFCLAALCASDLK